MSCYLFAIFCLIVLIFKCLVWLIFWWLGRCKNFKISCRSSNFVWFKNVVLSLKSNQQLVVDNVWFSSSYWNQQHKKPLALCLSGIRIRVGPEVEGESTKRDGPEGGRGSRKRDGDQSLVERLLRLLRFLSRYVSLCVTDVSVEVADKKRGLEVVGSCDRFLLQVHNDRAVSSLSATFVGFSLSCIATQISKVWKIVFDARIQLDVEERRQRHHVKCLDVNCSNFGVILDEEVSLHLLTSSNARERDGDDDDDDGYDDAVTGRSSGDLHDDLAHQEIPPPSMRFLPELLRANISDATVALLWNGADSRELIASFKRLSSETLIHIDSVPRDIKVDASVSQFLVCSGTREMFFTNQHSFRFFASREEVSLAHDCRECQVTYLHDDVAFYSKAIGRLCRRLDTSSGARTSSSSSSSSSSSFLKTMTSGIQQRKLFLSISNFSFVLPCDLRSKFVLAWPTLHVSFLNMSQDAVLSDYLFEAEVTSMHLRLVRNNTNNNNREDLHVEMSAKRHFWDTPVHAGLVMVKVICYGRNVCVESMIDSLRFELSSPILSAVQSLDRASGDDLRALLHWLKQRKREEPSDRPTNEGKLSSIQMCLQLSSLNVFLCHENHASVMMRCDSASIPSCSRGDLSLLLVGIKCTHFLRSGKFHSITRSADVTQEVASLPICSINFNFPPKNVVVEAGEKVVLVWSYSVHVCLAEILRQTMDVLGRGWKETGEKRDDDARGGRGRMEVMLMFSCSVHVKLSEEHYTKCDLEDFQLEQTSTDGTIIKANSLTLSTDHHPFLTVKNMKLKSDTRGEKFAAERSIIPEFLLLNNRAWLFASESLSFVFPYNHNFAAWFEEVKCLRKWLRLKHRSATHQPSLSADVFIFLESISIQICDDPFEVKLGDNYELLCDESVENEKRLNALNKRIDELKTNNNFIPEEKVESLYTSLKEKMSQVYIQRANQMYSQSPMRTSLCTWAVQSFELLLLSDPSMSTRRDVLDFVREVNSESPLPDDLELHTWYLRRIRCSLSSLDLHLRDFPHPMLDISDWSFSGRFCGAESFGGRGGQRSATIDLGHPWGSCSIVRNLPPVKFYYDINSEMKNFLMAYGACWEPIIAQISLSLNKIFRPSVDPSPPLPFWDKWRYLLHGNLTILMDKSSWMCHASLDPYNTTEFMDWTWSDLVFKWVTGEVSFEGDLEVLLRTASKYDECCFLKWNSLLLAYTLSWKCSGEPNDHHSILPCSPDHVATLPNPKDHDTYASFRSTSLTFGWTMKSLTHPCSSPLNFNSVSPGDIFSPGPSSSPKCLFYSSTIRWMDHLKICLGRISRPIKRGRHFKTPVTGKPKFTRHVRRINFSLALPSLNCSYWSSFRRTFGVELNSGPIKLDASVAVETKRPGDSAAPLTRRAQRVVGSMRFNAHFQSVAVWLSSQIHQRKTKFKPLENERSFLLSVDKVDYQRVEDQQAGTSYKASDQPLQQVEVHDLKGCWTPYNRDILFALHDSYSKAQMLQRNLSADALKGVKVEPACPSSRKSSKSSDREFGFSRSSAQLPHADALLQKLINESESKFVAVHEEITGAGVDMEHLQGYHVCQTDDVVRKKWIVTLVNSQVMLSGCETSGCIVVSTPRASLLSCLRSPVLTSNHQLRSKTTMVGSIESMQYYATITDDIRPESIRWLTTRDIEERMSCTSDSASLTLENIINDTDDVQTDVSHIQRIISRCQCQFYWAWYGELEDEMLEVPLQIDSASPDGYSDMMKVQEGIDAFTLIHHDLNICTNSVQYATALDIVNNLLLHVEPKRKELSEKLMDMRFKLQLSSDLDQKTPIFLKQSHLRKLVERVRFLEREVYVSQRSCNEDETQELLKDLEDTKEQINFLSEELALMLSCYRESQLQTSSSSSSLSTSSQRHSTVKREAMMTRKIDLYLQHVEWRLNESDGQIGISHIVLSNFLYTKTMHENDCGSHQLELGWCQVTNLLPENHAYKDVLAPQDPLSRASLGNKRSMLRVLCRFKSPVGGISIKEHFEVNVVPLSIQMTSRFYSLVMMFFFPGKPVESDEESVSDLEESGSTSSLTLAPPKKKFASLRKKSSTVCSVNDIDKMKERAARNNMFIYIKISEVSLKVSYKSEKDKHIMNIRDFQFLSPTLEYHNQTWSWHDLTMTLKRECKKVIIAQALRQKLHIKSKSLFGDIMVFPRGVTGSDEDTDKTKLLLGLSLPDSKQKKPKKKKGIFF